MLIVLQVTLNFAIIYLFIYFVIKRSGTLCFILLQSLFTCDISLPCTIKICMLKCIMPMINHKKINNILSDLNLESYFKEFCQSTTIIIMYSCWDNKLLLLMGYLRHLLKNKFHKITKFT